MDFRNIYYFIKVSECNSISAAAKKLFISQQALSQSIRKLEEEIDEKLFYRHAHGIELTEAGKYLRGKFYGTCLQYDQYMKETKEHFGLEEDVIEFCTAPGVFRSISPDYLTDYEAGNPKVKIKRKEMLDLECEKYIRKDPRYFGISTKPWYSQGIQYIPMQREPLLCIVNKSHWAAERESVSMRELVNENFAYFTEDYNITYRTTKGCKNQGFTPRIVYESTDVSQLVKRVNDNKGILICVRHVYEESNHENLVCVPIEEEEMYWEVGIICQDYRKLDKKTQKFLNALFEKIKAVE